MRERSIHIGSVADREVADELAPDEVRKEQPTEPILIGRLRFEHDALAILEPERERAVAVIERERP